MPNWFIACTNRCDDVTEQDCCTPATVASTMNMTYNRPDYVAPFDSPKKWKRGADDKFDPLTYSDRFKDIDNKKPKNRQYGLPILPQPAYVDLKPNTNQIDNDGNEIVSGGIQVHKKQWDISYFKADHTVDKDDCEDPSAEIEKWQEGSKI